NRERSQALDFEAARSSVYAHAIIEYLQARPVPRGAIYFSKSFGKDVPSAPPLPAPFVIIHVQRQRCKNRAARSRIRGAPSLDRMPQNAAHLLGRHGVRYFAAHLCRLSASLRT